MKTIRLSWAMSLSLFLLIAFFGCKKTESIGPPGEQGIVGPQGDPGPKGFNGSNGGINNLFFSDWKAPDFKYPASSSNPDFATVTIDEQTVTQEVIDSGVVVVYFRDLDADGGVYKFDYYTDTSTATLRLAKGKIYLYVSYEPKNFQVRYLIIPPGYSINARSAIRMPDFNDYNETCGYLGVMP